MILTGKIVRGSGRGRGIGVPTLNVEADGSGLEFGVYAVKAILGGESYLGAMNWGGRPTFGEEKPVMEVHLLDFSGEVYGEMVEIEVLEKLRDVRRFEDKEALVRQIQQDIEAVVAHKNSMTKRE